MIRGLRGKKGGFGPKRPPMVVESPSPHALVGKWMVVLAVAVGGIAFAWQAYTDQGDPTSVLIMMILGTLVLGVAVSLIDKGALLREMSRSKAFVNDLRHQTVPKVLESSISQPGVIRSAFHEMVRQVLYDPRSVAVDPIFEAMDERLSERLMLVSLLTRFAGVLGMAGTLCGLMVTLTAMGEAVAGSEGKQGPDLMIELFSEEGAMAGLGGAFLTTLWGSLTAMLLRALTWAQTTSRRRFINHYHELFKASILPDLLADRDGDLDSGHASKPASHDDRSEPASLILGRNGDAPRYQTARV